MSQKNKMRCPQCGAEMNQHAKKINFQIGLMESQAMDPDFEGVVEEIHTCPKCGWTASRMAS